MNEPTKRSSLTREAILEAATQVVGQEGVHHLTIDAVAQAAGISKGGLLYHFRSKDELVLAMIEQHQERFLRSMDEQRACDPQPGAPGAWHRAYIKTSFNVLRDPDRVTASLMAAAGTNPELLEKHREGMTACMENARNDGLDALDSALIHFSLDGMILHRIAGFPLPPTEEMVAIEARLLSMAGLA